MIARTVLLITFLLVSIPAMSASLPDFAALVKSEGSAVVQITALNKAVEDEDLQSQLDKLLPGAPDGSEEDDLGRGDGLGSGFIISSNGYIVTNAHVVDGSDDVKVLLQSRKRYNAEVIGLDKASDIALLKIDGIGLPFVRLGDSSELVAGTWVMAIGQPYGFENTVTIGIISAVSRMLPRDSYMAFLQMDVAINPGNSGGPLFNTNGEVIGINSQIFSNTGGYQGLSFAIPINAAKNVITQLRDTGKVTRGWLGIRISDMSYDDAEEMGLDIPVGAVVESVSLGGPASLSGVLAGDIIVEFNSKLIDVKSQLPIAVGVVPIGDTVIAKVLRNGEELYLNVKVGDIELAEVSFAAVEAEVIATTALSTIGVTVIDHNNGGEGVQIIDVEPFGLADDTGLLKGDIIIQVAQSMIRTVDDFKLADSTMIPGESTLFLIKRDGKMFFKSILFAN